MRVSERMLRLKVTVRGRREDHTGTGEEGGHLDGESDGKEIRESREKENGKRAT